MARVDRPRRGRAQLPPAARRARRGRGAVRGGQGRRLRPRRGRPAPARRSPAAPTWLAVATAAEAAELRAELPEARLLVLGALTPEELELALERRRRHRGLAAGVPRARPRARRGARAHARGCTSSTTPAWAGSASATPSAVARAGRRGGRGRRGRAGRPLDPLRDRRRAATRTFFERAARALPRARRCRCGRGTPACSLHAANSAATLREPGLALRHGPLRDRDLRPRPVRRGPGARRASSRRSSCAPTSPT